MKEFSLLFQASPTNHQSFELYNRENRLNCIDNLKTMTDIFQNGQEEIKMIDFMKNIYKKYKVLNQLTDRQSNKFQSQIVSLLVDQQENVDLQVLSNIIAKDGFQAFLIDVLGNILERNPTKNSVEMLKSYESNLQSIKKEQNQLQKKNKILQRKQERLKATEQQMLSVCKQKVGLLQSEAIKKILAKEAQVKKSINALLNQVKSKEKVLLEKIELVKANKTTIKLIEQKEKSLNQKLKALQKRQKQLRNKDDSQLLVKKDIQIQQMAEINNKLKENLKQLTTKHKNIQLAYRKIKGDNQKLINQRQALTKEKSNTKNEQRVTKKFELDNLQLSLITPELSDKPLQQQVIKRLSLIPRIISNQKEKAQVLAILSQVMNQQSFFVEQNLQQSSQEDDQALSFLKLQECGQNPHQNLLKQIQSFDTQNSKDKEAFFKNNTLQKWTQKTSQLRYPLEICNRLLQIMLQLLQKCSNSQKMVNCYSREHVISHLQKIYLCHQSNQQIAESTTLVLSRIKLWKNQIKLFENFRKAIEIRKLLQSENSLLFINIKYLM